MKLLQLNVWGGRIKNGLTRFIKEGDYDVICLQEAVWDNNNTGFLENFVDTVDIIKKECGIKYEIRSSHFGIELLRGESNQELGNVILSKIPFRETEEKCIYGEYNIASSLENYKKTIEADTHKYSAQKVVLENGLVILNYHGYWRANPLGNETTVKCMKKVAEMVKNEKRPVVVCGDFNITHEAKAMRELDFLTNLTAINHIKTTLRNIRFVIDVPCDHILVSDNVSYKNFEVIDAKVSDHRALTVEINI